MGRAVALQAIFLSTGTASRKDRQIAVAVVVISLLVFLCLVPFASRPLPQVWAFIPVYESAISISDFITAAILFIQFNISRSRPVLALACGYLFTSLMAIPHALTFPGLFAPAGLLGAGPHSTAWLYMAWHGGLPVAVITYALLKNSQGAPVLRSEPGLGAMLSSIGMALGAVVVATLIATAGKAMLPPLLIDASYTTTYIVVASVVLALAALAFLALWFSRPHAVLDLWLMVVMSAWVFDVALSAVLNTRRFDLGFYAGRAYGLLAGTFVLVVLLAETGALYAPLARLFEAEHKEHRREAEERRRIFETSLDLILVTDRTGNFIRVSPSSLPTLGYRPEDMIGRNAVEFLYAGDLEATRSEMRAARRGKKTRNFESRYIHKDGRLVTLAWSGVWSEPEQRHFFIGRDVSEQKRTERMKDEFIANVSHELRTPLTSIAGSLGLIMGTAAGELPERLQRLLMLAQSNSQRLIKLVNDILDIEKLESGQVTFKFRLVGLRQLIEQTVEANLGFADTYLVRLRHDIRAEGEVWADPDRLMQAITNLISNAVKFSPPDCEVVVGVERRGENLRLSVSDQGPGIPAEFKPRIFQKFAQADGTNAKKIGGTGLGLSIVKEIVGRLGGSVGFTDSRGGGTIFYLDLPCCDRAAAADGATVPPRASPIAASG